MTDPNEPTLTAPVIKEAHAIDAEREKRADFPAFPNAPSVQTPDVDEDLIPQAIRRIEQQAKAFRRLMACFRCAMMEVETKFRVLNEEFSLRYDRNPIETVKTRLKSLQSIAEKLKRSNQPITIRSIEENLHDVAGVRVICSFYEDVYRLAEALLKQDDVFLVEKKDYIMHPKENGYRSLHLIIETPIYLEEEKRMMKVEIQLRTIAMDCWASLEHQLNYKKEIPEDIRAWMYEELRQCAEMSADLDRRMEAVRQRLGLDE